MSKRGLEREVQARTLRLGKRRTDGARVSRTDEQQLTEQANKRDDERHRGELAVTLDRMERDLERVRELVPRVVAGPEPRSPMRAIANGLKALRTMDS